MGRQHIILLLSLVPVLALASVFWTCQPAFAAPEPPATLTMVADPLRRHVLAIQPGYTLFVVFDTPIEFVAIGDEQLLTVAVRGPVGVVALKANQRTGRTNLHVQAGGVLLVFEVRVAVIGRTADVVRVVTRGTGMGPGAREPALSGSQAPSPTTAHTTETDVPSSESFSPSRTSAQQQPQLDHPRTFLTEAQLFRVQELMQSEIHAAFQAYRTSGGIEIRYHISNTSGVPWRIVPRRILVRTDGKLIFPRLQRRSPERDGAPVPEGAEETGLLVLGRHASSVELLFPLFSPTPDPKRAPVLFRVWFDELETLVPVNTP